jgi:hypothetical protein
MRILISLPLLALSLAACATLPGTESTPFLPAGVFNTYEDNDVGAINQSAWAFASSANTKGNPVAAAKAVIALEYLPGELKGNPRWVGLDASIPLRLGQAREAVRQILGIRPDAPPQAVVNTMLALSLDLRAGNQPAAMQVLTSPVFTLPPARTLQILSNLPYVPQANLATARAAEEAFEANSEGG